MNTRIKLCGLKRVEDIEAVNELMPEFIGFIFVKESKRYISPKDALMLRKSLSEDIISVGVFKDNPVGEVIKTLKSGAISVIQLHGNEDESYISAIRSQTAAIIIKAFGIKNALDIEAANASTADFVLLDNPKGGSGCVFDHRLLENIDRPYFLAGGLDAENINDVINKYQPYAVDVSSKIETNGYKDKDKMKAFVEAVRERK